MKLTGMIRSLCSHLDSTKAAFALGFSCSLLIASFYVFMLAPLIGRGEDFGDDAHDGYLELAEQVARGNGFVFEENGPPNLHRPPFYPLLIAPVTLLDGQWRRLGVIVIHSLLLGGTCSLLSGLGRLLFSPSVAVGAVFLVLLSPWTYLNVKNPMSPITQAFLYTALVYLFYRYWTDSSGFRQWMPMVLGALAAALALTHGAMLPVTVVVFAATYFAGYAPGRQALRRIVGIALLVMLTLMAPWMYRNYRIFDRFVPVVSSYGFAYFGGLTHWRIAGAAARTPEENYREAALRYLGLADREDELVQYSGLTDVAVDMRFNEAARAHMRSEPGLFMRKALLNAVELYFPFITAPYLAEPIFRWEALAITCLHLFLWTLGLLGLWRSFGDSQLFRLRVSLVLAILCPVIWYIPFITFVGHSLYTYSSFPLLALLASSILMELGFKTQASDSRPE